MSTIQKIFDIFQIDQQIKGNSANTIKYYNNCIKSMSTYISLETPITSLTLADLKNWYLYMTKNDITTTTIQTYIRGIRAFLNWCYQENYIVECIPDKLRLPKAKRRAINILTPAETETLFNFFDLKDIIGLRNWCICSLMLDSGLRLHEIVTLRISSLHIPESYIIVDGKGNKERFVPLGLHTRKNLMRYLHRRTVYENTPYLFLTSKHKNITDYTVNVLFRRLKKSTGISRIRAHLLRHTFATRYLENGGDIYSLQLILGHTSLEMVKKYVHSAHSATVKNFPKYSPLDTILN